MAWTAARTWTTGELVTAAIMNTHVRDNLLETAVAKVTTAGDLAYASGANALQRLAIGATSRVLTAQGAGVLGWDNPTLYWATTDVTTSQTTTSTSYTDLATAGPSVTLSPGQTMDHLIIVSGTIASGVDGNYNFMGVSIAGAGAAESNSIYSRWVNDARFERHVLSAAVASGSTHTAKYRVTAGTGTFADRRITAIAL